MLTGDLPRTVDEAELAGWDGLEIQCAACRSLYILGWHHIRRRSGYRKLGEIKQRLRCRRCRVPPEKVALVRTVILRPGGTPKSETVTF
jgi:hypothetical protein